MKNAAGSLYSFGCDRSIEMTRMCRGFGHECFCCDGLAVPMKSGVCDAVLSVAVVHHFSTLERRVAAVRELARLLRPGGQLVICVWAKEQKKFEAERQQDVMVKWEYHAPGRKKPKRAEVQEVCPVYQRFYHLFVEGELEELIFCVPELELVTSCFDRDNWYAVARKKDVRKTFMDVAFEEAEIAFKEGEVPVGCVFVDCEGNALCKGHNLTKATKNATTHAELVAIESLGLAERDKLRGATLYVTCEPCIMCAAALRLVGILNSEPTEVFRGVSARLCCC